MTFKNYKQLDLSAVVKTISTLQARIAERFPDSGLRKVCGELLTVATDSQAKVEWLNRPLIEFRLAVAAIILCGVLGAIYSFSLFDFKMKTLAVNEVIQVTESLINDIFLVGASLFFLVSLETKLKRSRAMKTLHELRAIAHVIDMHQLTKDPSALNGAQTTKSSPERSMNSYQLRRYLDYSSEMLSLTGKVAALYSQKLPDHEIVNAAGQIEDLCTGLSQKIWQKIVVLSAEPKLSAPPPDASETPSAPTEG